MAAFAAMTVVDGRGRGSMFFLFPEMPASAGMTVG
jgi:hypothetical protein